MAVVTVDVDFLAALPAFRAAERAGLDALAQAAESVTVDAGDRWDSGQPVVVVNGGLRIHDQRHRSIDLVGPLELWTPGVGEYAVAAAVTTLVRLPEDAVDLAWIGDADVTEIAAAGRRLASGPGLATTQVRDVMDPVVVVAPETPARVAAAEVTKAGASAALVQLPEGIAIVTDTDLRVRLVAEGRPADTPVGALATPEPHAVSPDTSLASALDEMLDAGVGHLAVIADGRPVGMLTEVAILTKVRDPFSVVAAARAASSVDELTRLYRGLPALVAGLEGSGLEGLTVVRLLSKVGEAIAGRVVALLHDELGEPPAPYALVSLGSMARREQGLVTDQDHALVIADGADADPWYSTFAQGFTDAMATIGYPRCAGNVMCSNPDWRGDVTGWRRRWGDFLVEPSPMHVMSSNIVLDTRVLAGDRDTAAPFTELGRRVADFPSFLLFLARSALEKHPPVGWFGRLRVERRGEHAGTFDVKAGALMPIVQAARVYGLMARVEAVGTVDRLRAAAGAGIVSDDLAVMLERGYELATRVRLLHHVNQWKASTPLDNRIDPDTLSSWDRMGLREVFKAIKSAQEALSMEFQGAYVN